MIKNQKILLNREYDNSYFFKRGVSKEIFDLFCLGTLLPSNNFSVFFHNTPTFPIYDLLGELQGFVFRLGSEKSKYINIGFKKSEQLYGIHLAQSEILKQNSVIITEGLFDVLIPFSYGIKNVVGIFGNVISEKQAAILASFTNNFILALDSDTSGIHGTDRSEKIIKSLFPNINITKKILFPYKDFGDYILHHGEFYAKETQDYPFQ